MKTKNATTCATHVLARIRANVRIIKTSMVRVSTTVTALELVLKGKTVKGKTVAISATIINVSTAENVGFGQMVACVNPAVTARGLVLPVQLARHATYVVQQIAITADV